ncbi:MAG: DUF4012 domain-containing protein [Candidatus Chisholmbacteria bacterium]|nr:DUF4012 domain-containing protein [Candidatus Chisholmbacteria bacterium]
MPSELTIESHLNESLALVINADNFIGQYLLEVLPTLSLKVATQLSKVHRQPDYLFYFVSEDTNLRQSLSSFPDTTKVLLCFPLSLTLKPDPFQFHPNLRLVRLGPHLYGPGMDLTASTPLAQLFSAIKHGDHLVVPGDGLEVIYPTFITDAASGLTKAMFTPHTAGHEFFLLDPQPISILNFVFLLRQLAPGRQIIDFGPPIPSNPLDLPSNWLDTQAQLNWQPSVSLRSGITRTLSWLSSGASPTSLPYSLPSSPPPSEKPSPSSKSRLFLVVLAFLLFLASPFISLLIYSFIGLHRLTAAQTSLTSAQLTRSHLQARQSVTSFDRSRQALNILSSTLGRFIFSPTLYRFDKLLTAFTTLAQAQENLAQAALSVTTATPAIIGKTTIDPIDQLTQTHLYLSQAKVKLSLAQTELSKPRPRLEAIKLLKVGESVQQFNHYLNQSLQAVSEADTATQVLLNLFKGPKKTYLVLLQNNGELRPTGGFIDAIALMTVESGRLLDLEFINVYSADSQLQGQVDPPPPIKTYLGETNWYLRDANWDPDFPSTARQAEWFIDKELHRDVHGTLALNLFVLEELLKVLGDVHLSDINQTLTSTNLFDRAQTFHQLNLTSTTSTPADIFSPTLQALYQKLPQAEPTTWFNLAVSLRNLLNQKHLLFSPLDPQLVPLIQSRGWDGSLSPPPPASDSADFLGIYEANVGINKANFFVTRNLHHQLRVFKEDHLLATTIIHYQNTSSSTTWPAGNYKNYLRFYLPAGSTLQEITINDQVIPTDQITLTTEHTRTVVGFLVTVPSQSESTVTVNYQLPIKLTFDPNHKSLYTLFIPKQSGTRPDPLTVKITLPPYIRVTRTTPNREPVPGAITFLTDLTTNRLFTLELEK